MKKGKTKKSLGQQPDIFFDLEINKYVYCLKTYEKLKKSLVSNSRFFFYFEGKSVFFTLPKN
jgi:hypothetical protein